MKADTSSAILKLTGLSRIRSERTIGPDEGIEDTRTIDSYITVNRQLPSKLLYRLALRRLKDLQPCGTLADLGCGPGFFTGDMAKAFPALKIAALDISAEMLSRAGKHFSSHIRSREIHRTQGDLQQLPFKESSLDFIVSTLSLHHWVNPAEAFSEIYRVLKPEGQFLIFDTRRDSPGFFYRGLRCMQRWIYPAHLNKINEPISSVSASYTPEEAGKLAGHTPFTELNVTGGLCWLFITGRKP